MPQSWVADERLWDKAKVAAEKQGKGNDYAYITGIYKQMGGKVKKMQKAEEMTEMQNEIENLDTLLKARDVGKLTKKVITNKNGHKQTVYVRSGEEPAKAAGAQKKSEVKTGRYHNDFGHHAFEVTKRSDGRYNIHDENGKKWMTNIDSKEAANFISEHEKKGTLHSDEGPEIPKPTKEQLALRTHNVGLDVFENKTALIPSIIASSVSDDREKDEKFSKRFEKYFEKRIVALYHSNPTWKKKLDSEKGRDHAYMLANHWMDSAEKNGLDKLEKEATMNKAANLDFASSMLLMKAASSITQAQKDLYTVVRDICTAVEGDDNRRRIYGAVEGIDDGWCLDATRPYNAIERAYLVATGGTISDEEREKLATALNAIIQDNAAKQKARQEEREEKVERNVTEEVKLIKAAQPKAVSPARTVTAFLPWQMNLLKADMKR